MADKPVSKVVEQSLDDLMLTYGYLTAELVVKEATDPEHVLHSHFEWDDSIAGHKYRLIQGQQMIRSITVEFVNLSGRNRNMRKFLNTVTEDLPEESGAKRVYVTVNEIVSTEATLAAQVAQMKLEWAAFRKRWKYLEEFAEVVGYIE